MHSTSPRDSYEDADDDTRAEPVGARRRLERSLHDDQAPSTRLQEAAWPPQELTFAGPPTAEHHSSRQLQQQAHRPVDPTIEAYSRRRGYGDDEICHITLSEPVALEVVAFETESCCDILRVKAAADGAVAAVETAAAEASRGSGGVGGVGTWRDVPTASFDVAADREGASLLGQRTAEPSTAEPITSDGGAHEPDSTRPTHPLWHSYHGERGPPDGMVVTELMWLSDSGVSRSGWALCAAGHRADLSSSTATEWVLHGPAFPWAHVAAASYFPLTCLLASLLIAAASTVVLCMSDGRAATLAGEADEADGAESGRVADGSSASDGGSIGAPMPTSHFEIHSGLGSATSVDTQEWASMPTASPARPVPAHAVYSARALAGVGAMANGGACAGMIVAAARACRHSSHECAPWLPLIWLGVVLSALALCEGLW